MREYERLLLENKAWAKERITDDPDFFRNMALVQKPNFLWIGCSDSRVPANEITGTAPGEMFVHRNIANLVVHTDLNLLSVLEYAIVYLKVQHVIVCGHYGCGGVAAAMSKKSYGTINKWLRSIKDVYRFHKPELDALSMPEERVRRLVELNVREQVLNLAKTSLVQKAWKHEQRPHLHGWVYALEDGLIKPLLDMSPESTVEDVYTYDDL